MADQRLQPRSPKPTLKLKWKISLILLQLRWTLPAPPPPPLLIPSTVAAVITATMCLLTIVARTPRRPSLVISTVVFFYMDSEPFLDQQELQEGVNFPSQIVGAIRSARSMWPSFLQIMQESQWCLDELSSCRSRGLPLFLYFTMSSLLSLGGQIRRKMSVW
jgi:hypothetical protein